MEWLQILKSTESGVDHGWTSAGPSVAPLIDLNGHAADSSACGDGSELVGSTMQAGMYKGLVWHGRWLLAHDRFTDCFKQLAISRISANICTCNTDDHDELPLRGAEEATAATAVLRQARLDVHRTLTFQV